MTRIIVTSPTARIQRLNEMSGNSAQEMLMRQYRRKRMIGAFLRRIATVASLALHSVTIANAISTMRMVRSIGLPSIYESLRTLASDTGALIQDVTGLDMAMRRYKKGIKLAFELQRSRRSSQNRPAIPVRTRAVAYGAI